MGQTVNLLVFTFGGSNPSSPTNADRATAGNTETPLSFYVGKAGKKCGSSSVDRASAFQAEGREFEPRLPLKDIMPM